MPGKPKKKWELPLKVFLSYSSEDSAQRNIFCGQLKSLEMDGLVEIWHDRLLPLGKWEPVLKEKLEGADLFILLVSRAFVVSEYCQKIEFERAHERYNSGDCEIIPVALKPYTWPGILSEFTAVPDPKKHIVDNPAYPGETGYAEAAEMLAVKIRQLAGRPAGKPIPIEQREPEPPPALPHLGLLPFLCDREQQEENVEDAFLTMPASTRPFVVISCGPDQECHEELLRRIRRKPLPDLLGVKEKPEDWRPMSFEWPVSSGSGTEVTAQFGPSVANYLGSLDTDTEKLKGSLRDGLTVIESELKGPLAEDDLSLLKSYLGYWNRWWSIELPIAARKALVVAIWIKCPNGTVDVEDLRRQLAFRTWPNIRGVILDELKPISARVAQKWALRDAVKAQYPPAQLSALAEEIRKVFPQDQDYLPMRTLAPGLLTALRKVKANKNG